MLRAPIIALKVLLNKNEDRLALIKQIVELAETARRDGLLALESKVNDIENPLVRTGIQMAVDGSTPEVVEEVLRTEVESIQSRHREGKGIMDQLGRFAPAYGMIGTLMGLIMMLQDMSDPVGDRCRYGRRTDHDALRGDRRERFLHHPSRRKLGTDQSKRDDQFGNRDSRCDGNPIRVKAPARSTRSFEHSCRPNSVTLSNPDCGPPTLEALLNLKATRNSDGRRTRRSMGIPEWVVTFGDMMSLLLTFLSSCWFSLSEIKEEETYQALVDSMRRQFGYTKGPSMR